MGINRYYIINYISDVFIIDFIVHNFEALQTMNSVINTLIKLSSTSIMTSKHACALMRGNKVLATGMNYPIPTASIVGTAMRIHPCRRSGQRRETGEQATVSVGVHKLRCKKDVRFKAEYSTPWDRIVTAC